jgi:ATP-dependent helicase/nuclease subunit A
MSTSSDDVRQAGFWPGTADAAHDQRSLSGSGHGLDDRQVISTALDDTLIVEAAAGTGKTTELVTRIVLLIQSGRARVTEIVAVTFSEKAAGELKLRLREEIERARTNPATTDSDARLLDAAVVEFEEAHISTIHGFCAELLRERPVEAQVDPSFEVLTETQSDLLFDEAFRSWMEAALHQPGEGVRRSLRRPRYVSWWRDTDDSDGPVERLRRAGRELLQWRDHPAPWKRPDWDRAATIDRVVESVLDVAAMTAQPIYERDILFQDTASLRRMAGEIARTAEPSPRDYDGLEALLTTLATDRDLANKRKGSGAMYSNTIARQAVLDAREALLTALRTFRDVANADLAGLLHGELQDCMRGYELRKQRTGALDFLDLLIGARNLVRDCAPVRAAFQKRFKYILVDEFQDTDPLQAELLMRLASAEVTAEPTVAHLNSLGAMVGKPATPPPFKIRPGALFVVGDPKQSIYRFRRADIGMYQRTRDDLAQQGARSVVLKQSFRSVPNIQRFINAAFRDVMRRDDDSLQPGYVELVQHRPAIPEQPSVIALPVPRPYGRYRIAKKNIEQSLPEAIGAFVRWLIAESGWSVTAAGETPRPVRASDVCLLFRRFIAYQDDVTRSYVDALESRGVPHLLVGGKTFHEREEVDAVRTALSAIEWPEDELSVFATLRGPLFAIGDEELLEYHARRRQESRGHVFHPYHVPDALPPHLIAIGEALGTLRALHAGRNYRPVADTIGRLIEATRAHAGFMLWRGGEQVLANVLHIAELARQYESEGGLSFRGFVETLRAAADRAQAPEAPILEEGSDGVRLMTVHKAKGLEFPVVILADMTCGLSRDEAQRYLEPSRELCAIKLAGWAPLDLIENNDREARRDEAEGVRLAYVAATRARDLLVVPAIGDAPFDEGWVSPLNAALYPPLDDRQSPRKGDGVPAFKGKDTLLDRPDGEMAGLATVRPGEYPMADAESGESFSVVWWDPLLLDRPGEDARGLRRDDLISKDARPQDVAVDRERYRAWQERRAETLDRGARPSLKVVTATEWVRAKEPSAADPDPSAVVIHNATVPGARPHGRRFGVLVHALLAAVSIDATVEEVNDLATLQARILGARDEERDAAAAIVHRTLKHRVMDEARAALAAGHACRRESPISFVRDDVLIDGQMDLVFETGGGWKVVDFKTDAELGEAEDVYRRQVALYAQALAQITGRPAQATILRV